MARLVRRAKRIEGKRTRVLEVLETDKERKRRKRERKREEPVKKKEEPKRKVTVLPTIEAKRKETGIQKFAKTRVGKVLTSPKTTAALALTLAGGVGLAARGVAAVGKAVITRTAIKGKVSLTTQRAFVGRSSQSGVDKIFHKTREVARRFGTNTKSQGLTTSMVTKIGLTVGAAGLFVGAVGSYPFASFIKEEAIQTLNIPILVAMQKGDFETAQKQVDAVDEILAQRFTIIDAIPYANVVKQLNTFFDAAEKSNDAWRTLIEKGIAERGEPSFAEERESADAEARLRKLKEREVDAEYFALIREGRFEEAEELLQSELKGGN